MCTCCSFSIYRHVIHTTMQMWTLARFLPLVVGHLVPEDNKHWENFLCLFDIMDNFFAPHIAKDACGYVEALLSDHNSIFTYQLQ